MERFIIIVLLILILSLTWYWRRKLGEACRAAIIEPVSSDVQSEHLALLMPMMLPE